MTDDSLYRRELLRLAADATGAGHLDAPDGVGSAHNPVCSDRVTIEVALAGGRVTALAHQTQACILTQAAAALLADQAVGRDHAGLAALFGSVRAMLAGGPAVAGYDVFAGVAGHGARHVCVLLPLEAALRALDVAEPGAIAAQGEAGA